MNDFSGYNQIKIHPDDEKHTAFRTPLGVYCYTVLPFDLKNAGATYQRAMSIIFKEHLCKTVEYYVDDLAIKSMNKEDHLQDLRTVFNLMRRYHLKINPAKSFIEVPSGKYLALIVISERIFLDPEKVKAINEMPPPHNLKDMRGLQGKLAYIRCFISNLSG